MNLLTNAALGLALGVITNSPVAPIGSLEWAAIRAASHAFDMPDAKHVEYGGVITEHDGKLQWSAFPHTDHSPDSVRIDIKKMVMPGDFLVGVYHIHPCMPRSHYTHLLSPPDVMMAYFFGVPQFMLDECTGDVHEYDPLRDHVRDTGEEVAVRGEHCERITAVLPVGRIIGNIGKHTEDVEPLVLLPVVCVPLP